MRKTVLAGLASAFAAASAFGGTIIYPGTGFAVPDLGSPTSSIVVPLGDAGSLTAVSLTMTWEPNHTFVGDLVVTLSNGIVTADLFHRVGKTATASGFGDSSDLDGPYTFVDGGADFAAAAAAAAFGAAVPAGSYSASTNIFNGILATTNPSISLNSAFAGQDRAGTWTLAISDLAGGDSGTVSSWSLSLTTPDTAVPEPSSLALVGAALILTGLIRRRT